MHSHYGFQELENTHSYSKYLQRQTYGDLEYRLLGDRTRKQPSIGWHLHCARNLVYDMMYDTVVSVTDYSWV